MFLSFPATTARVSGSQLDCSGKLDQSAQASQNLAPEAEEERINSISSTITVLERTLASTSQVASGRALETALNRQISVRREEIQFIRRRSRSTSVIVHTSTPNISQGQNQEASFFGVEEDLAISSEQPPSVEQSQAIALPFEIYCDPVPEPTEGSLEVRLDPPPQPPGERQPLLPIQWKIPIIPTPDSFEADKENHFEFGDPQPTTMGDDEDPEYAAFSKRVEEGHIKLQTVFDMYDPDIYTPLMIRQHQNEWLNKVQQSFENLMITYGEGQKFAKDEAAKQEFIQAKGKVKTEVNDFITKLNVKAMQRSIGDPPPPSSNPSTRSYSGFSREDANFAEDRRDEKARKAAQAGFDVDAEKNDKDIAALTDEIEKIEDWSEASSHQVEDAMLKIPEWKKKFKSIEDLCYSMKRTAKTHDLDDPNDPDDKLKEIEEAMKILQNLMEKQIKEIEFQDESRCLYSCTKHRSATVQYPTFSGLSNEDFFKFQKEIEATFVANKVRREDKVKQLRSCLKGQPLKYIQESCKHIEDAWKTLKDVYGSPMQLVDYRLKKLSSMGTLPKPDSLAHHHVQCQIEWYIELELLLNDLVNLSERDPDCHNSVFNPATIKTILNLFPRQLCNEMNLLDGYAEEKLKNMIQYISNLRDAAKKLLPQGKNDDSGAKQRKGNVASNVSNVPHQKRKETCRICKALEAQGDTRDLYEDHANNKADGCPRFMTTMTTPERRRILNIAKMCMFCLDPVFVKKSPAHRHYRCPAFEKPQSYTCKGENCRVHYLVCEKHFDENKEKRKQNDKFWESRKKKFIHSTSHLSIIPSSVSTTPSSVSTGDRGRSDEVILDLLAAPTNKPQVSQPGAVHNHRVDLGLQEAGEKLKKIARGAFVRPLPSGEPLFLFSYVDGKTRELFCFMDSGCSHVIWKTGVPIKELDGIKTRAGPFTINAAADTSVRVNDEYLCLVNRMDGTKQLMLGVCIDKITTTFPLIDTSEAYKELVDNAPNDVKKLVASLKCPKLIGGDPDMLLGIHYNNCFPEVVYRMENGLFIAKLKLCSSNGYSGAIGGPHRSFAQLAHQVGDTNHLMSCFINGIKMFRKMGPPKLPVPLVSFEDVMFAQSMNYGEIREAIDYEHNSCGEVHEALDDLPCAFGFTMKCQNCGDDFQDNIKEILDEVSGHMDKEMYEKFVLAAKTTEPDERLHDLKTLMKIMEQGISLEYRCPKCRNCWDCRQTSDTERISIREELEDEYIKKCVDIDFKAQKIVAKLPMRGDVNQYLSNNRNIALKVLDSQCNKLKNDPDGKAVVIKAFKKLIDRGFAVYYEDLNVDQKAKIDSKPVQYYLPWRVVYKTSVTSPCRPVMDASSRTPQLPDGRGGRCLNDIVMKGKISTLNLLNMLLRFVIGPVAFAGDLKAFYTSIALIEEQWNLQRVLWRENLDLEDESKELIITTLIFGVRAVSALSERAVLNLASHIRNVNARLAELLQDSRFVDDIADSDSDQDVVKKLLKEADELFESVGLSCKGWSISGSAPHPEVTNDNITVDVGGMIWSPVLDTLSVKIPPLHFGKKIRGKINIGTQIFDGSFKDLEKFVPEKLSRKQVVSKMASIFDPFGKYVPLTGGMKVHMRLAVLETSDWDDAVSNDTRALWIKNFWILHKLRGMSFNRARIPTDAVNTEMDLIAAVDASNELKIAGVWARFLRKNGEYSSQLIIGRSLLVKEGSSIPKEELEAATIGSNLLWIVRKALDKWIKSYILLVDSVIALCWITSENKRLSLFHRNRVNQVRMNMDIDCLYWVDSLQNPADVATRSGKIQETSVGPDSVWERGYPWMTGSLNEAMEKEIIKPASTLRITDKENDDYEKGIVFERTPEVLVKGHVITEERVDKMKERSVFSKYIFQPSKFDFRKTILITSYVFKFIRLCKFKRLKKIDKSFKMFPAVFSTSQVNVKFDNDEVQADATRSPEVRLDPNSQAHICWGSDKAGQPDGHGGRVLVFDDSDIARAQQYWFQKATAEVIKFVSQDTVKRAGVMKDGILYCRSRIHDGQRLMQTGGCDIDDIGAEIGLNLMTPLVDRYSPIAYSIAMFIHNQVGRHAGYETCFRLSLEYCHIIQGSSLFKQLGQECSKCKMMRKKYLDCIMGPVSDHQLAITPPHYVSYVDLDGPYDVFTPGHEKETRTRKVISAKVYIMTFCCPSTKLCNLQVIEAKNAEAVMEGLTRLGCEVGMPSILLLDQETSFMKMVKDAEISLKDLSHRGWKEFGIKFEVAPVQGHNYHGVVERRIKSVQNCFEKIGLKKVRLHATGFQTFCKLVENNLNNLPLGYSHGRDSVNSPILKIITPNMMRMGRINSRSLSGPLRYPAGPKDYLKKVDDTYEMFFKVWDTAHIPTLIPQPKWFKDTPTLKTNDIVYFKKVESDWSDNWTVGQVENVIKSKDGVVRRATIRYYSGRDSATGQFMMETTDRAARSLVRLFSIEDAYFVEDMAEVERLITNLEDNEEAAHVSPIRIERSQSGNYSIVNNGGKSMNKSDSEMNGCSMCCCSGHCLLSHFPGASSKLYDYQVWSNELYPTMVLDPWSDEVIFDQDQFQDDPFLHDVDQFVHPHDEVNQLITALNTQFDMDVDQF